MGRKKLELLVGKLRFMHLAVPGAVSHFYHIQRALSQAGTDRAWLSPAFHCNIPDWKILADQTANRPTHLVKIVRREPTPLGCCDASGLGAGVVRLDPYCLGKDLVWCHPFPADIISDLVSSTNRGRTITNSGLELATLVLHKATLLVPVPESRLAAPRPGSDNTVTVSRSTKEVSTINPLVADLLHLYALHLRQFFLNPSVFNDPGIENCMADDASRLLELSDISFLAHMSSVYPQLQSF